MDLNRLFDERNIDGGGDDDNDDDGGGGGGEVVKLKNELFRTKNALANQIFKRHQIVSELWSRYDRKNDELRECRRANFKELGAVLRSLYVFESKLRREQQHIRRQLGERDAVIRKQQVEIAKLKQTLASCYHHRHHYHDKDEPQKSTGDNETITSKPDLISSISSPPPAQSNGPPLTKNNDVIDSSVPVKLDGGVKKNILKAVDAGTGGVPCKKTAKNNINFNNKNVYSKTVTDLSLNDISSFPNPTPNNNLFVVSNSVFSKNEFTYNDLSKETVAPIKQNGKIITSALKKGDKYPCPKSVHFGKTTHIPEPDEDNQTDIVKTVETLLLQCGDSTTESENETSSTASTETSPSVSQMVRKFESICTAPDRPVGPRGHLSPTGDANGTSCYIAEHDLRAAAELKTDDTDPLDPCTGAPNGGGGSSDDSLGDLDPRNNFEEFRFEDCDLEYKEYGRPEADGNEFPAKSSSSSSLSVAAAAAAAATGNGGTENCCNGVTGVNYESFLEATGLSQKSIITVPPPPPQPQSVANNNRNAYGSHRSVQKPKDVKSRSRAKSTSFEFRPPSSLTAAAYPSTVKYWTEPYL